MLIIRDKPKNNNSSTAVCHFISSGALSSDNIYSKLVNVTIAEVHNVICSAAQIVEHSFDCDMMTLSTTYVYDICLGQASYVPRILVMVAMSGPVLTVK